MSIDPLAEKYAYNSPNAFQENKMGMGRELEGLELFSPWLNIAVSSSSPITSTPLLGTSDAVKLSAEVGEAGSKTEIHHVIPRALKGEDVVKAARDEGFKFEGQENKVPLDKFSKATEEGQHGSHPKYNNAVKEMLKNGPAEGVSASEFVRNIVSEVKETIKNNPGTKTNDLFKTQTVIENTAVPKPELPKPAPKQKEKPCETCI
jgi:hypothetical protein